MLPHMMLRFKGRGPMGSRMVRQEARALLWVAVLLVAACGGDDGESSGDPKGSGGTSGGGGSSGTTAVPGCSAAPDCGSCTACFDECVCNGGGSDLCLQSCLNQMGMCGNGVVEGTEQCDTANLNGETCASATMNAKPMGTLSCTTTCSLNVGNCLGGSSGFGGTGGMSGSGGFGG